MKPILLVGPPGVGKTTLAKLAAKQFGYDMIELNASDVRNKGRIQEILEPILSSESLLGHPMIFIDEVDGIHGRANYGGAETLIKILKFLAKKFGRDFVCCCKRYWIWPRRRGRD